MPRVPKFGTGFLPLFLLPLAHFCSLVHDFLVQLEEMIKQIKFGFIMNSPVKIRRFQQKTKFWQSLCFPQNLTSLSSGNSTMADLKFELNDRVRVRV